MVYVRDSSDECKRIVRSHDDLTINQVATKLQIDDKSIRDRIQTLTRRCEMRLLRFAVTLFVISTFGYAQHVGWGGFSRGGSASGSFRGVRPAPPGSMGPARFAPRLSPYSVRGPRSFGGPGMNMASSSMQRAPYHSPHGGHHGHDGHFHNHAFFFPFRGFPPVWGYSYWPSIFDDWDNWGNFDSQPTGDYAPP